MKIEKGLPPLLKTLGYSKIINRDIQDLKSHGILDMESLTKAAEHSRLKPQVKTRVKQVLHLLENSKGRGSVVKETMLSFPTRKGEGRILLMENGSIALLDASIDELSLFIRKRKRRIQSELKTTMSNLAHIMKIAQSFGIDTSDDFPRPMSLSNTFAECSSGIPIRTSPPCGTVHSFLPSGKDRKTGNSGN